MFPIRDHNPSGRTPYVTYALMAVNIGVFLSYLSLMADERALGSSITPMPCCPRG